MLQAEGENLQPFNLRWFFDQVQSIVTFHHAQSCKHRLELAQEGAAYPPAAAAAGGTKATVPEQLQVQVLPPKVPAKEWSPKTTGAIEPVFVKAPTPLNEQDRAGNLKRVFDVASMTVSPTATVDINMPVLCTSSTVHGDFLLIANSSCSMPKC